MNSRLAEYLDAQIVPDVYFRLGEAIFHYLIDEFQDTSPIQWRNLLPLIDNSLSQGGSLFVVGDTKQAIYGFRDADYTIMRGLETGNPFPSSPKNVEELHTNYRSDGAVVGFSEHVFQKVLPRIEAYREAASDSGLLTYRQEAKSGREAAGVRRDVHPRQGRQGRAGEGAPLQPARRGFSKGVTAARTLRCSPSGTTTSSR